MYIILAYSVKTVQQGISAFEFCVSFDIFLIITLECGNIDWNAQQLFLDITSVNKRTKVNDIISLFQLLIGLLLHLPCVDSCGYPTHRFTSLLCQFVLFSQNI